MLRVLRLPRTFTAPSGLIVVAVIATLLLSSAPAQASQFDITPLSLAFSAKKSSGTLSLNNRSQDTLRFHVTAAAWRQREDGSMELTPTKDIVFFPAMLTLRSGESRQIRVGTRVKQGDVERTYRLMVQELPPLTKSKEDAASAIQLLTKMGLPVFIEAAAPRVKPALTTPVVRGREAHFSVKNTGNTHMRVESLILRAKGADETLHKEELNAWYVLAGGTRKYVVTLPAEVCAKATSLEVEMETEHGSPKVALPQLHCGT